mmetsp:Transcript_8225/g.15517  ORF Transcript_8225/g.15517 Transcript_8225/m.15517 type:complete len:305 (+) Transcript_8225:127-1041(+)
MHHRSFIAQPRPGNPVSEENSCSFLRLLLVVMLRASIGVIALEYLRTAAHKPIMLVVIQIEQSGQLGVNLVTSVAADPLLILRQPVSRHVAVDVRGELPPLDVLAGVPPPGQSDQLAAIDLLGQVVFDPLEHCIRERPIVDEAHHHVLPHAWRGVVVGQKVRVPHLIRDSPDCICLFRCQHVPDLERQLLAVFRGLQVDVLPDLVGVLHGGKPMLGLQHLGHFIDAEDVPDAPVPVRVAAVRRVHNSVGDHRLVRREHLRLGLLLLQFHRAINRHLFRLGCLGESCGSAAAAACEHTLRSCRER